ncbi:BEN domain-containing protein 5-like [Haemaphysalis longicornis]
MPEPKWHWILRGTTDGKFTLDLARHLWSQEEAAERSLTGQACRSMTGAAQKVTASPVKVEVVKNCLAKYVELHPLPEPPADVRVKNARKYLRNFFTEAGHQGKRVRLPKNAQKNKPVE